MIQFSPSSEQYTITFYMLFKEGQKNSTPIIMRHQIESLYLYVCKSIDEVQIAYILLFNSSKFFHDLNPTFPNSFSRASQMGEWACTYALWNQLTMRLFKCCRKYQNKIENLNKNRFGSFEISPNWRLDPVWEFDHGNNSRKFCCSVLFDIISYWQKLNRFHRAKARSSVAQSI